MYCTNCQHELKENESFCSHCGKPVNGEAAYVPSNVDTSIVPDEIRKWNWGAFSLNILWGIGNHAYLSLLCLIPLFNLIWVFVCGVKGNEWAWKSGEFKNVDEFLVAQKTWNRAGLTLFIFQVAIIAIYILLAVCFIGSIASSF